MQTIALMGYIMFKVYKALLYIAEFVSAVFVIVLAVVGINLLIGGYREMKIDRKQREFNRKTA